MVNLPPESRAAVINSALPLVREAETIVARVRQDVDAYAEIKKRLEGAAAYLGEDPFTIPPLPSGLESPPGDGRAGESPSGAGIGQPRSWREFGVKVLEGTDRGYTTAELMIRAESLGLGDWARRYRQSPNGYLAAMRLAEAMGEIARQNGVTYHPDVLRRIQAGELEDTRPQRRPGGFKAAILAAIARSGPLTAGQVVEVLSRDPETREIATTRPNVIYTNLHKLLRGEALVKDGSTYRLPSQPSVAENVTLFPKPAGGANV